MRTGSCLCGAVRYAVNGPIGPVDHCHCSMCRRARPADHEFITIGSLDDATGIEPEAHIFVGSKASWYPITDALPRHEGYPFGDG